jgi:uncharacterized DUF497 family protein
MGLKQKTFKHKKHGLDFIDAPIVFKDLNAIGRPDAKKRF